MVTRIIFNGQEYASAEAMPAEVRNAYEQALAQLADADRNGIPDVLERGGAGNVIGIQQSSITVNGRRYESVDQMPAVVRFLYDQAIRHVDANRSGIAAALEAAGSGVDTPAETVGAVAPAANGPARAPRANARFITALDQTQNVLSMVLVVLLSAVAGGVIVFGHSMIRNMDESSRSQGGAVYVGLGMVVVLGLILGGFVNLWWRRQK